MNHPHSTFTRTVVKTLTYRAISIIADIIVFYLLTGSLNLALAFGGVMIVISTIIYFLHERAWATIRWGKNGISPKY